MPLSSQNSGHRDGKVLFAADKHVQLTQEKCCGCLRPFSAKGASSHRQYRKQEVEEPCILHAGAGDELYYLHTYPPMLVEAVP